MKTLARKIPGIGAFINALDAIHSEVVDQRKRIGDLGRRIDNQTALSMAVIADVIVAASAAPSRSGVAANSATPPSSRLVVSLTSYPGRIREASAAIFSLLRQNTKPDCVVLWLASDQFSGLEADLPDQILRLRNLGLEIRWCADLKSYKKLIPALRAFPNDLIVTADDDIYYRTDWLGNLVDAYRNRPDAIHAHRCHRIAFDKAGKTLPYSEWIRENSPHRPGSPVNFPTTGSGVIFPPGCFHDDVLDDKLFMRLAPTADDIWFWAMAALKGTPIYEVDGGHSDFISLDTSDARHANSLFAVNRQNNDGQFKRVLEHYPVLAEKLAQAREVDS